MKHYKIVIKSNKPIPNLAAAKIIVLMYSDQRCFLCTTYKPEQGLMEFQDFQGRDIILEDEFNPRAIAIFTKLGIKVYTE